MINYSLDSAKRTVMKLLNLSDRCASVPSRIRFIHLSLSFVIFLIENYTVDITEEIILYTQIFDIKSIESFNNTVYLLQELLSKLEILK